MVSSRWSRHSPDPSLAHETTRNLLNIWEGESSASEASEESRSDKTVSTCTPIEWDILEEFQESWDSSASGNEEDMDHGSTMTELTSTLPEQAVTMKQKDVFSDSNDAEQVHFKQRIIVSL